MIDRSETGAMQLVKESLRKGRELSAGDLRFSIKITQPFTSTRELPEPVILSARSAL
jgi:hypothetical protein